MLDKAGLRSHFRALRQKFKTSSIEFARANASINQHLKSLLSDLGALAGPILAYWGYKSEPQLELSGVMALPRIYPDQSMRFFKLSDTRSDLSHFKKNQYGILEPQEDESSEVLGDEAKAVLVPGLAFDSSGARLGSGQGFYDRFLSTHSHIPRVGIGFHFQLSSEDLPRESWDMPMDWLVTDRSIIRFKRKG